MDFSGHREGSAWCSSEDGGTHTAAGMLQTLLQLTQGSGSSLCLHKSLFNKTNPGSSRRNSPSQQHSCPCSLSTASSHTTNPINPQPRCFSHFNTASRAHTALGNARSTLQTAGMLLSHPWEGTLCFPASSQHPVSPASSSLQTLCGFSSRNDISAKQGSATAPGSAELNQCSQKRGFQQALHMITSAIMHFPTNRWGESENYLFSPF